MSSCHFVLVVIVSTIDVFFPAFTISLLMLNHVITEASASSQPSFKSAVEHSQQPTKPEQSVLDDHRSVASSISSFHDEDYQDYTEPTQLRGRRFLLLTSLGAGVITLALTSAMFHIPDGNPARLPLIILFIMIFTAVYSPGAGAIPFLYSAEIWPNEGREYVKTCTGNLNQR